MSGRLETFFKSRFGFLRNDSDGLSPAKIKDALEKKIIERRKHARDGYVVPNTYSIQMGTEDYQRLSSARLIEDLTVFTEKVLIQSDSFMDGALSVRIHEDISMKKGKFDIVSRYEDTKPNAAAAVDSDTLVLSRSEFTAPLNLPPVRRLASLRVIRGVDAKAYLEIGERKVYLGRRDQNDFILTDLNVSRLHASVEYERHRHVIRDTGSLNGLFINGEKKDSVCLLSGDEIGMGNTLLRYEVL